MISVAEESGRLDQELVRIANVTEGDLDRQLKTAVAFAEPLMLFFIAGFHRHDFHRHGAPDLHHAGLHQMNGDMKTPESAWTDRPANPKSMNMKTRTLTQTESIDAAAGLHPGGTAAGAGHPGHPGGHRAVRKFTGRSEAGRRSRPPKRRSPPSRPPWTPSRWTTAITPRARTG